MHISATLRNSYQTNHVTVTTENNPKEVTIPGKAEGFGSAVNGGELLFLALATCFCNDIYREAARRNISIEAVEVTVTREFGQEGEPATHISYTANVQASSSSSAEITQLIQHVDQIAEVHNTLRKGIPVALRSI